MMNFSSPLHRALRSYGIVTLWISLFSILMAPSLLAQGADGLQAMVDGARQKLAADTNNQALVSIQRGTGVASFVRLPEAGGPYQTKLKAETQEAAAAAFFREYGALFGIQDAAATLHLTRNTGDWLNTRHLVYQQSYQGVEVFGGQIRVHFNAQGQITTVNGVYVPEVKINITPAIAAAAAAQAATQQVQAQFKAKELKSSDLTVIGNRLLVYRSGLFQGVGGRTHLVYEVTVANQDRSVHELIYLDAHTGKKVDQITGNHEGINRKIYNGGFTPALNVWSEGNSLPYVGTDAAGINDLINYAEDAYNLYSTLSNGAFHSWDGADGIMHSVLNDPSISCPNANWNGVSTNYCNGLSTDDVVAHEWSHAYTQSTHELIYAWQSGALNESYSDIFGELIDLLNGAGLDTPNTLRTAGACTVHTSGAGDNSVRWLMGEESTAFGGAIRDMWNPTCYSDPGKVSDTEYWCTTGDGGGVHSNSGIPNHLFALLVDGGTYNGQTISRLNTTKAAHIYWRAATVYQGPYTDFAQHADALEAACNDLRLSGVALPRLSTNTPAPAASTQVMSAANCQEVAEAIAAVELRAEPTQCGFAPLLDPSAPPLCADPGAVQSFWLTDWESGLGSWTVGTRDVANPATFDTPNWSAVGGLPDGRSGMAAFVADTPGGGNCSTDDETGVLYLESPVITIPAGAAVPRVAFDHWVSSEPEYDGGNLKISVNGGPWQLVPASAFDFNVYNGLLTSTFNTNPMATEPAFTGSDGGSLSGSWGQSQLNLTGIASPGDTIQLRLEMGQDGCFGYIGWYVDNVQAYYCAGEVPSICNSYDGTNKGAPEWDRPIGMGPEISELGPVRYQVQAFQVTASGDYHIASQQTYDGYLHLYAGTFDPLNPFSGLIAANDDGSGGIGTSELDVNLASGVTYYLVTSAYVYGLEGDFSNTICGPGDLLLGITHYFSSSTGGVAGGVSFGDEDIVAYNNMLGVWSMYFDASDVGVPAAADVDAFHVLPNGHLLLSFDTPVTLGGVLYDDSDVVRFAATSTGPTTAGAFSLYLSGATAGLTTDAEDIDAIALDINGDLLVSTLGSFSVPGAAGALAGADEDVIRWRGAIWLRRFDGSDIELLDVNEDIWGLWMAPNQAVYISTQSVFTVTGGVSGDPDDLFRCDPYSLGGITDCNNSFYWDAGGAGFGSGEIIDGYSQTNNMPVMAFLAATAASNDATEQNMGDDDASNGDIFTESDLSEDEATEDGAFRLYFPAINR